MLLLILLILYFDFYGVSSVTPDVKTALDKYVSWVPTYL